MTGSSNFKVFFSLIRFAFLNFKSVQLSSSFQLSSENLECTKKWDYLLCSFLKEGDILHSQLYLTPVRVKANPPSCFDDVAFNFAKLFFKNKPRTATISNYGNKPSQSVLSSFAKVP